MKEQNNVLISIQLDKKLLEQIKVKAKDNGLTVSALLRLLAIKDLKSSN